MSSVTSILLLLCSRTSYMQSIIKILSSGYQSLGCLWFGNFRFGPTQLVIRDLFMTLDPNFRSSTKNNAYLGGCMSIFVNVSQRKMNWYGFLLLNLSTLIYAGWFFKHTANAHNVIVDFDHMSKSDLMAHIVVLVKLCMLEYFQIFDWIMLQVLCVLTTEYPL